VLPPLIRDAIKRRYEILPYIYSLSLESHLSASPPQRWVGWGYESDPEVWTTSLKRGEKQYWFGDVILVGGVYKPGKNTARIYLPRKGSKDFDYGYVNMNSPYNYLASGEWVEIHSEWKTNIPLLAKIGGAIPVGKSIATRAPGEMDAASSVLEEDDYRGVEIFPPPAAPHTEQCSLRHGWKTMAFRLILGFHGLRLVIAPRKKKSQLGSSRMNIMPSSPRGKIYILYFITVMSGTLSPMMGRIRNI